MRTLSITKLLLGFFLCSAIMGYGQEKQHFSGQLSVGPYQGEAEYIFRLDGKDTILDGAFRMFRSNLDALLEDKDDVFSFTGTFENGFPNGDWQFQFGEFQSENSTKVVDLQYRLNISGTSNEASGAIIKGKPDGLWAFSTKKIENSAAEETLFSSSITFDNGIPQQSFRIENKSSTLVGRFLRNGLAHDIWTLFTDGVSETTESWYFKEGVLEKIEKQVEGQTSTVTIYTVASLHAKTINLDKRYLDILNLLQQKDDSSGVPTEGINALLAENASHYKEIDDILSALGKSEFMPEFKVMANYYPLDSTEILQLEKIREMHTPSWETSQALLRNTQLNILRRSDREIQFLYDVINTFSDSFLRPVGELLEYDQQNLIEFVPRSHLLDIVWPMGMPSIGLDIAGQDSKFVGPNAANYNFEENTLASAGQLTQYASQSLDSIVQVLNERLLKDQRQNEVVDLEETMISKVDHLNQLTDSLSGQGSRLESKALKRIQSFGEEQLKSYSDMADDPSKVPLGKRVMECLAQLDELARVIANLPAQRAEIQEKYQDAVWNPFMANIMNEAVKKRITGAYENILLPHILDQIITDLSCDNAENLKQTLVKLHNRMLAMRDEDTSKIERKLRKEKDPTAILNLFNLQTGDK